MKLCSFTADGTTRAGIVLDGEIADLGRSMQDLLSAGPAAMNAASEASGPRYALKDVQPAAPVPLPGKVLAIAANYPKHIKEMGRERPEHQIWFNKQRTCITGPGEAIRVPKVSEQVDFEGELVAVIGRRCRNVPEDRAFEVIAGYMIGNDVSVRDWQRRTPTMQLGKSFDTHGPTGPWIVTPDELGDPADLSIRTWVSGELMQDGHTSDMLFSLPEQIALLTTVFTLEPGDLIFTGTPAGVGAARTPPRWLAPGDTVRIEIERIGALENKVVADNAGTVIQ